MLGPCPFTHDLEKFLGELLLMCVLNLKRIHHEPFELICSHHLYSDWRMTSRRQVQHETITSPQGSTWGNFHLPNFQNFTFFNTDFIEGLVQDCSISIANTLEILQSFTKPLIYDLKENFLQILDGSFTCPGLSGSEIWWPLSPEHSQILSILGIKLGIPLHFYKVSTMRPITETDNKQLTWHVCKLSFAAHGWSERFVCGCECQRRSWELWKERNWKW